MSGTREPSPKRELPDADRALRFAAVVAAMTIIGVVVSFDILRDGTLEATSVGLLTGVIGPVITVLILRGSGGQGK